MSNAAGATQASTRFDAWGNILAQTGNTPHFGYTGQVPDANGLIHYRARYYDPAMGRFTQRDPAGFADGINRYAYVGNSPTNFTDPLGLGRLNAAVMNGPQTTFPGNDSNNSNFNPMPTINSGCGGQVGICHTPDQNVQPPQIYAQAGEWWDDNRTSIGSAAADLSAQTAIISTGLTATIPVDGPIGAAPAIFFGGVSFIAAGIDSLASPPLSPAQITGSILDTSISAALPTVPSMVYDAIRPLGTIANNPSIFQSGIKSSHPLSRR